MRKPLAIPVLAALLAGPAFTAQAGGQQSATSENTAVLQAQGRQPGSSEQASGFLQRQSGGELLTEEVIGMSVTNPQKQDVGKIDGLIVDRQGRVKGAVLEVGGFLGIGGKQVALPWSALKVDPAQQIAMVTMGKKQLEQAPEYKTRKAIQAEKQAEQERRQAVPSSQNGLPYTAPSAPASGGGEG